MSPNTLCPYCHGLLPPEQADWCDLCQHLFHVDCMVTDSLDYPVCYDCASADHHMTYIEGAEHITTGVSLDVRL